MNDIIFVTNKDGFILFINSDGKRFAELIGSIENNSFHYLELFEQNSRKKIQSHIEKANENSISSVEPVHGELSQIPFSIRAELKLELMYDDQGNMVTSAGLIKCLEKENDPSQFYKQVYLDFIDNLPLGVYRTGASGKIHFVNKGFVDILGFDSESEIYKLNIEEFYVRKGDRNKLLQSWSESKMNALEIEIYTKEHKVIWVKSSGRAIKDADGNVLFYDGIIEDITKQRENDLRIKESESKLKELNASKDKFFSIISHDLRSPFNQFIGATELLLTKLDEYDKGMIRKFLSLLNVEAVQSYRLLENLLQWSRNQRGLINFEPQPVNFYKLVNDLLLIYKPIATNKKIELEVQVSFDLYVYADKDMLSTILRNLISNAIKFTSHGGSVSVSATLERNVEKAYTEFLKVGVHDTGVGIPEEILPKLFNINEEVTAKGTYNESGTGLGLVLCKEFVEKHNGEIWADSKFGQGSNFIFTIPN